MIRFLLSAFICLLIGFGCSTPTKEESKMQQMIPDNTPYIAGLVEATNDTVHHFPEVVIGYMTDVVWDTDNWNHPDMLDNYPGLYNPTLWTQVVRTSEYFGFGYQAEPEAVVKVTGPLNHPKQKTVKYTSMGNGVYGDKEHQLSLLAGYQYKLNVTLPDGQTYMTQTIIPEEVSIAVPDSFSMQLKYKHYADGTPHEESINRYPIIHPYPDKEFLTVLQWNSSVDRQLLLLEPDQQFLFHDRSPYLRDGFYGISMTDNMQDTLKLYWGQVLNKPKNEIWNEQDYWLRFSYFSEGIGHKFHPITNMHSLKGTEEYHNKIFDPFAKNLSQRDTTYLFDVSTIRKVGREGQALPKDSLDAIGFFGGYFSVYRRTTMYADRTFDLDSVLNAKTRHN